MEDGGLRCTQPDRWCSATEGNTSTSSELGWNKNFCALTNQKRRFGRRFRQAMEKREHAWCSSKQHPCGWAGHQFNHTSITFLVSWLLLSLMPNVSNLKPANPLVSRWLLSIDCYNTNRSYLSRFSPVYSTALCLPPSRLQENTRTKRGHLRPHVRLPVVRPWVLRLLVCRVIKEKLY